MPVTALDGTGRVSRIGNPSCQASQTLNSGFGRAPPVPASLSSAPSENVKPGRRLGKAVRSLALAFALAALVVSGCTYPVPFGPKGDNSNPGQRAGDYLKSAPYTSVLVELDYVEGSAPEPSALSLFQERLQAATGKSVEVVRTPGIQGQGSSHRYTAQELGSMEGQYRSQFSEGNRAVLYMMYLDGGFERDSDDQRVLGAAYRGSSVAMMKGNLREVSKRNALDVGRPELVNIEGSVLVHELGHVLGLVNIGIPMQTPHEDTSHPGHSTNDKSVMYWQVEQVSLVGSVLGEVPPNDYDANDKADLQAARR